VATVGLNVCVCVCVCVCVPVCVCIPAVNLISVFCEHTPTQSHTRGRGLRCVQRALHCEPSIARQSAVTLREC
jgi:hypothetical protein